MVSVLFISGYDRIMTYTVTPLIVLKNSFFDRGFRITIQNRISAGDSGDIIILLSKHIFSMVKEDQHILNNESRTITLLKKLRKKFNRVIWFDNSDSTSITHFELMPYIDLYLKKQIFTDLNNYRRKLIGGRIFTDFYHQKFDIQYDGKYSDYHFLDEKDQFKLKVSWNIGLGDVINSFSRFHQSFSIVFRQNLNYNFIQNAFSVFEHKKFDVFLKTTANLKNEIVSYHRKRLVEDLQIISSNRKLNSIIQGERVSKKNLRYQMSSAKIMPSPFGWGEIGARDFEAFYYGSCLLKPDMTHLKTFPDYFVSKKTYIPFKWDFCDLEEQLAILLDDKDLRLEIAENGQQIYRNSISEEGFEEFVNHFIESIN